MIKRIFFLILLLTAYPVAAQDATCDADTDYMTEGAALVEAGDYDAAYDAYTCAMEAAPEDYIPVARRAEVSLLAGNYVEALDDYALLRARFYPDDLGVYGKILVEYRDAIAADPENISLYVFRSFNRWWEEQVDSSMRDYERILERDPDNLYAILWRGNVLQYIGNEDAAAEDFARALELDPENPQVHLIMAEAYVASGDFEQALESLDIAADLGFSESPVLLDLRSEALGGLGDQEAAAAAYAAFVEAVATDVVEGEPLVAGETVDLEMVPGRAYRLPISAEAGTQLEIVTSGDPYEMDSFIALLAPDGTPVAGNDDSPRLDAVIPSYEVSESGEYTLLVTTYIGVGEGTLSVTLNVE